MAATLITPLLLQLFTAPSQFHLSSWWRLQLCLELSCRNVHIVFDHVRLEPFQARY